MDDFDRLFDDLSRMMRDSLSSDTKPSRRVPVDLIKDDENMMMYVTFSSTNDVTVDVKDDLFYIDKGKVEERIFKLPYKVNKKTLKKTYNEITGIVDIEIKIDDKIMEK